MSTKTKATVKTVTKAIKSGVTAPKASKPKAKAEPLVIPAIEAAEPKFESAEHIAVVSPVSHARRALNEASIMAMIKRSPVTVEQLARILHEKFGVSRGALNHQLDFELKKRKTPRFKLDAKNRLVVVGELGPLSFRRHKETA